MKKCMMPLLLAAMMILTACNQDINFKKTNYLPIAHELVGKTPDQAAKHLEKKGFQLTPTEEMLGVSYYTKVSKDSTLRVVVGYPLNSDTVRAYYINADLKGLNNCEQACRVYSDWSKYAYNTIFAEVSLWTAMVDSEVYEEETAYIDGGLAPILKSMVDMYHAAGEIDDETYAEIVKSFGRKRANFEPMLKEKDFLRDYDPYEVYAHINGNVDMTSLMSGMQNLKGIVGVLSGEMDRNNAAQPSFFVSFAYTGEQSIEDLMGGMFGEETAAPALSKKPLFRIK